MKPENIVRTMLNWLKKLFGIKEKKVEEVIPHNPSPLVVRLLEWIESQTELPNCKCQYEKSSTEITDDRRVEGDETTSYHFEHKDKIIEICNIKTGSTSYKDKYGLLASGEWRYSLCGSDIYLIRSISLFSEVKQEWVEISTSTLLDMNTNEDNKPYLKKIFDKVDELYYSSSDEYLSSKKERARRSEEEASAISEFLTKPL